ncbi:MAG: aminotransferase class III-fold pyridoxal phosphate-dependent enzyme [Chloroflexi bacterium]|nr:aminotransferase class III-fold pyridoxal phosphate-dependent enzyme [Chloroflexota bacterium]
MITGHAADRTTPAQAIALARDLYGIDVSAEPLPGEYDDNFRLDATDSSLVLAAGSDRYVLKVMHPDQPHELIDLQCAALDHLAALAPDLTLPRVQRTGTGSAVARVVDGTGDMRWAWMLSYVAGTPLAHARPHGDDLLRDLGRFLGRMDEALASFSHPAAARPLKWDLSGAGWIGHFLHYIADPVRRGLVERHLEAFQRDVQPSLLHQRQSAIHNDANDYNVLVGPPLPLPRRVASVIDFGDMLHTQTVSEVVIAAAYALLDKADPLRAASAVVGGYHAAYPLTDEEIALIFPLICMRLCVSVTNSAYRRANEPDDPYLTISERPAWVALERLRAIHPRFAHYKLREACGLEPNPRSTAVKTWLQAKSADSASVLEMDVKTTPAVALDLSIGSLMLGANPANMERAALDAMIPREMAAAGAQIGIGRYDEARAIYQTTAFATSNNPTVERRTIHLGLDFFVPAGTGVHAPLDGVVHVVNDNAAPQDYGPLIILRHETSDGVPFFTLYGHLDRAPLSTLTPGMAVTAGQRIAGVGAPPGNGDWTPHLHFQIITDLLDLNHDFPGVARASQRAIWTSLSPDPNLLLGIPADRFPAPEPPKAETLAGRRARLGRNLSISYREPLKIVRGWRQYLYDETGRAYLDVYNNVPLVGHSHPQVVQAIQQQVALLNTNTRYLHDQIVRYAERLTAHMPEPLRVCYFLNSASEANELALRLARAYTGHEDMIVLDAAYHGHTNSLIDISPYKFNGPGGTGRKPWVHIAPIPDDYRGEYRRDDPERGLKYAAHVGELIDGLHVAGRGLAAYIAESLPSVGGQIVPPPGYLEAVYEQVRVAGGLCIADEVQVGFGRLGTHFWGFAMQNVVPDIVVLGKPIGNGMPLAAVVTTPAIADAFDNGMEFFSTFGGNPVSCAAGLAVLDVLESEGLQENARKVGESWMTMLRTLMDRHPVIGDVRGSGLFLGVELVKSRTTLEPAADQASYVVNRLREEGILAGTDGPYHNVIKLRPPLIFSKNDAVLFTTALDGILGEDGARGEGAGCV